MSGFNGTKDFGFFGSTTIGGGVFVSGFYGSFYDTTTQTSTINTPTAIQLNTTDFASGFVIENNTLGFPTRIKALNTGKYNLQFSAQLDRPSGGNPKQIDIWIRINNIDVPYTNTSLDIQANAGRLVAAWNFLLQLNANQYVEIMYSQDDAINIKTQPANLVIPYPATPSVIATIVQI